ncbi:hypothetical protein BTN49_2836 [Candidatus Enterovibrio escicola]|uniref:Uncharacterized protein n=1 Tax=Candidatus Enterovibrio escicola TaxID=1927127 RepID=A0A2A5T089_9GAMM|nr:hypothetical protein BTN49_2836 [Candidatus Enterovibrio escacola]
MAEADSFSQLSRTFGCLHLTISREIKLHIPNNFHGGY